MKAVLLAIGWVMSFCAAKAQLPASPAHEFAFSIGHAHLGSGVEGGDKKWLILPSLGFNYSYRFNPRWLVGIHSDIIIRNFTVEANLTATDLYLERSTPLASAVVVGYNVDEHLSFLLGAGAEFAHQGTLFLARVGTEYNWELSKKWRVGLLLKYDMKMERYDTWIFGANATRVFW